MAGVFGIEHDIDLQGSGKPVRNWAYANNGGGIYSPKKGRAAEVPAGPDGDAPRAAEDGQYYDAYALWNLQGPDFCCQRDGVNAGVTDMLLGRLQATIPTDTNPILGEFKH